MSPRAVILAGLVTLAQCDRNGSRTPGTTDPEPTAVAAPTPPRLVVLIVIDQLPSWSFDPQRGALEGGIARMLARGAYWPRSAYPYATTHTAPGHATIGSGSTPSVHGITANRWFDATLGRQLEVDEDPQGKVFDPRGRGTLDDGVSNVRLQVPGIADALHAKHPTSRSIAIGWKSRAAVTVLGRGVDLPLWFDAGAGALTTSRAFTEQLPQWVQDFAARTPVTALTSPWTPLDTERVKALAGGPDDAPDEADPQGLGKVFPHRAGEMKSPGKALAFTPQANTLLVDAALAAIEAEQLGADAAPDLLAVTFSPHDFAGHAWCQESWERVDHLLRIDRDLARLFDALDAKLGRDAWAAVLTSDHGARPSGARLEARGQFAPVFFTQELETLAESAAGDALGPGDWVLGVTTTEVKMTAAFAARTNDDRNRGLAAVIARLFDRGLLSVRRTDSFDSTQPGACVGDDVSALVCRSIHPKHSSDLYLVAPEWALINDDTNECTAHGSPWAYDREVPVVVMAPGYEPGVRDTTPSMLQLAPTLAAILGVPPPAAALAAPLPSRR